MTLTLILHETAPNGFNNLFGSRRGDVTPSLLQARQRQLSLDGTNPDTNYLNHDNHIVKIISGLAEHCSQSQAERLQGRAFVHEFSTRFLNGKTHGARLKKR
jgi:hypothetical protein